ncbi:hypothetical protein AB0C93_27710 [Streptomyces sp. NPDC048518]|uniref:hypothetical protein n=1 Tax=Streptomyces sp. NPDC048518 TaxID=3155029 RepID=UPI0033EB1590
MTLRSDLAELLAEAGIVDVDLDEAVADEHVRASAYRRAVSAIASSGSRDRDRAIVATIARDPLEFISKTAVVALVDDVAHEVSGPDEFRQWSDELLPEFDRFTEESHREFVRRRVHDWLLYLTVKDGHVPTADELAEVTDWMQRHLAEYARSPEVLAVVAESARTKKTRNLAKNRANSRELRAE